MTDQQLLELAAKAAGYIEEFCPDGWTDDGPWRWYAEMKWNPLTDDGDALRLAVKLRFVVEPHKLDVWVCFSGNQFPVEEPHNGDPYAATRRAIVRAAAEIGKSMEVTK